jgi:hypothetical protein
MLDSSALDVAIGMIFIFLAFSLFVSSVVEAIASMLKWRSSSLLQGVKDLLNDQNFADLAKSLYNHALVNPREPGSYAQANAAQAPQANAAQAPQANAAQAAKKSWKLPSYLKAEHFADAMIDIIGLAGKDKNAMKQAIDGANSLVSKDKNPQLNQLLVGIVDRTEGKLEQVQNNLASWFDNAMDRVGGAYKRRTQLCGFIIGLVLAAGFNVNAINIGKTLWRQPMLVKQIAPQKDLASMNVSKTLTTLKALDLPIGWSSEDVEDFTGGGVPLVTLIAGWLIVAVATLFGAPFWFDALQRIIRIKGSGPSPAEKQSKTGAEA